MMRLLAAALGFAAATIVAVTLLYAALNDWVWAVRIGTFGWPEIAADITLSVVALVATGWLVMKEFQEFTRR